MNKLYVFIGKPGCGKTTILKRLGIRYYDILSHIKRYFDKNGRMDEANTIKAYQDLFAELKGLSEEKIFLELGTNHAQFVMENLRNLGFETTLFFCLLNNEECLRRNRIGNNPMPEEPLMKRIARVFPDEHLKYISGMRYYEVDMGKSVEENCSFIAQLVR